MPRKTDSRWETEIFEVKAANRGWGSLRIAGELEKRFAANECPQDIEYPPSNATVHRILKRIWTGLTKEEQAKYEQLRWPEVCLQGHLPWEAATNVLELLRHYQGLDIPDLPLDSPEVLTWNEAQIEREKTVLDNGVSKRPTIRFTQWFWRLTCVAPEAPFMWRKEMASHLAAAEIVGDIRSLERIFRIAESQAVTEQWPLPALTLHFPFEEAHDDKN